MITGSTPGCSFAANPKGLPGRTIAGDCRTQFANKTVSPGMGMGCGHSNYGGARRHIDGLISIDIPVPRGTIDSRQRDITRTVLLVASDNGKLTQQREFSFSGLFRNYALQLRSNFGDGLIQQSGTRNVAGGEAMCIQRIRPGLAIMSGVDLRLAAWISTKWMPKA